MSKYLLVKCVTYRATLRVTDKSAQKRLSFGIGRTRPSVVWSLARLMHFISGGLGSSVFGEQLQPQRTLDMPNV